MDVLCQIATHPVTRHKTPIHNILSIALRFSISQKALGTLHEDGNVMPKHVEATIHSFSILSDDRSKASSKTVPPHSAT
jgi:hypothetical protein